MLSLCQSQPISVNLSEGAYLTIWVVTPDDKQNITSNNYKREGTSSFSGTVSGPEGTHTLHVEARNRYGITVSDSCSYFVVNPSDSDNDGIPDGKDNCSNPDCHIVNATGCPADSDGDGIRDCDDNCSNPDCHIVNATGCPADSDGDGIRDCDDNCPSEEGDSSHNGCPIPRSSAPSSSSPSTTQPVPQTPQSDTSINPAYIVSGVLLVVLIISFLAVYLSRNKRIKGSEIKKEPRTSNKELQELRRKLDEDYVEDRISREEYLEKKKDIEEA
ncbi:MAG: thrombospondin type 3 repeat-containing protein [Theionarchaea archaeon]|nr:thrombospondin type 3 repeat-containing protein [Theionarchaea archaeon]